MGLRHCKPSVLISWQKEEDRFDQSLNPELKKLLRYLMMVSTVFEMVSS
jgi:hypothetical protein